MIAINLNMDDSDLKNHWITTIKDLHQNFNYVWNKEKFGNYYYKKLYCYCKSCRNDWKNDCKNQEIVEYFGKNIQNFLTYLNNSWTN